MSFPNSPHNGYCLPARLESAYGLSRGPEQVDIKRDHATHQYPGTHSSQICLSSVSTINLGQVHKGNDGTCHACFILIGKAEQGPPPSVPRLSSFGIGADIDCCDDD